MPNPPNHPPAMPPKNAPQAIAKSKHDVLSFWFVEHGPQDWFHANPDFDRIIQKRFARWHNQAIAGQLRSWRDSAEGRLAEIVILDQFSRHLFRGDAQAYAADDLALQCAREAVAVNADRKVVDQRRQFFYLPYMHSESLNAHDEAQPLYHALAIKEVTEYEQQHRNIIQRFGRYPHRNAALNRKNTKDEETYLQAHPSPFG